jgi:tetratricopeptide (TPR) repeat protein
MGPVSVALLWLALSGAAGAAEGDDSPSEAPASDQERLEQAVAEYQSGRWDQAQIALTGLMSDASASQPVQQEARVYLGELLYVRGDKEAARKIFEHVLTIDPEFQVDPFRHPPEILAQFEIARSSVAPYPKPPAFDTKLGATLIPFGSYHLSHGKPVKGATLLVTQAAGLAVSLTMFVALFPEEARTYDVGSEKEQRVKAQRGVQVGAAAVFWSSAIYGWVDAQRLWRTERDSLASDMPIGFTISGRL